MKQNLSMKTHLQAIKIVLCALTLGACVAAQAMLPSPNSGMALIPAGPFIRGDANDFNISHDAPTNTVNVSAFQIDTNLISYANWQTVYNWATSHGYIFDNAGLGAAANHPVQTVNWYDTVKWCNARSEMESNNLLPCYYTDASHATVYRSGDIILTTNCVDWTANGYRLPTEAEWEKAARGNLSNPNRRFPLGNTISHSQAWYTSSGTLLPYDLGPANVLKTTTTPVGSFAPNGFGLFDMAGNAYEWCWDWYLTNYYTISPTSDPQGPTSGTTRVIRGGSWINEPGQLRCEYRGVRNPASPLNQIGFRCVRGKQSQTISFNSSNNQTNLTYGGGFIPLTATASSGSNVTFTVTSGQAAATITGNSLAIIGVGQVTVTASVDASASYSAASTNLIFMISKATPSVTVNVGTYTYTGSAQGPNSVTTPSSGSATYSYVGVSGTTYGPSATQPTGAGSYKATATVAADANYNSASSSATAFTIAKAASTVTVTGTTSFTYSGSAQGPNASTVTGSSGAVTYSYVGVSGTTFGPSATKPTGAGSYTVTATVAADANYNSASSSATAFSIAKATPTVTFTGMTSFTYSGSAQGPNSVTTSPVSTGSVTYSYVGVSGTTFGPSATQPTAAGSYTVTAAVAADANYNSASSSATAFSIAKATPTVTFTGMTSFTYSGSAQGPNSVTTSPVSTGSVTYSYVGVSGTTFGPSATQPTAAGSYTVTAAVVADANNNSALSSATPFSIGNAVLTVTANDASKSYGVTNPVFTASYSGFVNGETNIGPNSVLSGSPSLTTTATTSSNAGSYLITAAQGTLSATNYSFSFVNGTLTITNINGIVDPAALRAFIGNGIVDQAGLNVVLANYWASSPPHISDFDISAKTNFTFIITNFNFTMQFSTNLVNPNWQDLGQAVFQFTDTNAVNNQTGFYRLVAPTNQ